MQLSKVATVVSFFGALLIGIAAAYIAANSDDVAAVNGPSEVATFRTLAPINAHMLMGGWNGTWDHNDGDCTIEITRADGDQFSGVLTKDGAEIAFVGMLDRDTRTVSIQENEVINLGIYKEWSLGKNSGSISADGRTMSGTGYDKWGRYNWHVSR
jgi:hypothetical protein